MSLVYLLKHYQEWQQQ